MPKYSESSEWADIVPIPQQDGGPDALAAIAYTEEYSEAMAYLRAVMAQDEQSERVLDLTQHIIGMNPSHYTVWLFRAQTVFGLGKDLHEELQWLNGVSLRHLKNYQIWHHRQTIMSAINRLPTDEIAFLRTMLDQDAKNYHVWSYRQWLVRHFDLWDVDLPIVDELLDIDVRNNSAWNHRYFLLFTRDDVQPQRVSQEMQYAETKILLAPENQSPWNYLRGVVTKSKQGLSVLEHIAKQHPQSSHALDLMAEIYGQRGELESARQALDLLSTKFDPIRRNYWHYRKSLLIPSGA